MTGESAPVRKAIWDGCARVRAPRRRGPPVPLRGDARHRGGGDRPRARHGRAHARSAASARPCRIARRKRRRFRPRHAASSRSSHGSREALSALAAIGYGLASHDALAGVLAGLTLAMAILPNEFPVVVTMFLALGAWRLSRRRVLARRIPAVEPLGAATVLCVDKTGTLTENRMTVSEIRANGESFGLDRLRARAAPRVDARDGRVQHPREPTGSVRSDGARLQGARRRSARRHRAPARRLAARARVPADARSSRGRAGLARSRSRSASSSPRRERPRRSRSCARPAPRSARSIDEGFDALASKGLRVLAVARVGSERRRGSRGPRGAAASASSGSSGSSIRFARACPAPSQECRGAGIRVVMITGDYPVDRRGDRPPSRARRGRVVTGPELAAMDEERLRACVREHERLRPHAPGAEAPARPGARGQRRDRRR